MSEATRKRRLEALRLDRHKNDADDSLRNLIVKRWQSWDKLAILLKAMLEDTITIIPEHLRLLARSRFESVRHDANVPLVDGSVFPLEMSQPNLLVARTLQDCRPLANIYAEKLAEKPSPREDHWALIV